MTNFAQSGFVTPLNLDARDRTNLRYRLGVLLDQMASAEALNPNHSLLPELRDKATLLHRQCLGLQINHNLDLRRTQDSGWPRSTQYVPPNLPEPDRLISRGLLLNPACQIPWLPAIPDDHSHAIDFRLLTVQHSKAPWLPRTPRDPGFFSFSQAYPRARALCYLHAIVDVGSTFKRTLLAMDRSAGRLYLLELLLSKVPDGFLVALNTPEHPDTYPCVQLVLGNFP